MNLDFNFDVKDSYGKKLGTANVLLVKVFEEIPNGDKADKIRVLKKSLLQDGLLSIDEVDFEVVLEILKRARNTVAPVLIESILIYMAEKEKELKEEKKANA